MRNTFLLSLLLLAACAVSGYSQTDADREGVKRAALNYAEGWYEGNADKMESALSPDLAKRIARTNDRGQTMVDNMTAMRLVQATRGGSGKQTPAAEQKKDVTILDMMVNSATVKLEMRDWVDYLHVAKVNGKWVIINVLWEMKPKKDDKQKP